MLPTSWLTRCQSLLTHDRLGGSREFATVFCGSEAELEKRLERGDVARGHDDPLGLANRDHGLGVILGAVHQLPHLVDRFAGDSTVVTRPLPVHLRSAAVSTGTVPIGGGTLTVQRSVMAVAAGAATIRVQGRDDVLPRGGLVIPAFSLRVTKFCCTISGGCVLIGNLRLVVAEGRRNLISLGRTVQRVQVLFGGSRRVRATRVVLVRLCTVIHDPHPPHDLTAPMPTG